MPEQGSATQASWMETVRTRLQLTLLIVQVLAIVFGGMMMFLEVRGVTRDVHELKTDVRELRDSNAALEFIRRDIDDLRGRVSEVEKGDR